MILYHTATSQAQIYLHLATANDNDPQDCYTIQRRAKRKKRHNLYITQVLPFFYNYTYSQYLSDYGPVFPLQTDAGPQR